jgi:hypothetical protein
MESYDADLKNKEHVEELVLQWGIQTKDLQRDMAVLGTLQTINQPKGVEH